MNNLEIADLLRAVAASYQLKNEDENRFKIIAYQRAADAVEHASSELKDIWDEGKLEEIPGVGKSIAGHLGELFKTGTSTHFEEVMKDYPPQVFKLMELPMIGAKTAYKLVKELNIGKDNPVEELEKLAGEGKIALLEGFGEQSQQEIVTAISEFKNKKAKRLLLPYATTIAEEVISWLMKNSQVTKADPLGSLRRKVSTIGDIDIAVASDKPKEVIEHFVDYPKANRVIEKGEHTASILLPGNVQVDLMVQEIGSYGSLLQHFTGSKHHNVALREYALKKGMSLSEYGIKSDGKVDKFPTEKEFYAHLGLKWIPPELREDTGEIQVSREGKIPDLLELKDVRADLQIHSDFDIETSHDLGLSSMEEIADKASALGYEYLAFTEHNPSKSGHTASQIINILKRKKKKVDELNYSLMKRSNNGVKKVYNSLEIDITSDGELPLPEEAMQTLDFALVSIHSSFRGQKAKMTERVLSALSHPKAKIFAHPTARKINEREGIEVDWLRIFEFCLKNNKWLEINADPMRLDLPDFLVKEAVQKGVKLTLGTDSHHKDSMDNMRYGVFVARRGWATKTNIVNTRSWEDFDKMLY